MVANKTPALQGLRCLFSCWCGDRQMVVGRGGPDCAGLDLGGFFDVPHKVSIKNQLVMAFSRIESELAKNPVRATYNCVKC